MRFTPAQCCCNALPHRNALCPHGFLCMPQTPKLFVGISLAGHLICSTPQLSLHWSSLLETRGASLHRHRSDSSQAPSRWSLSWPLALPLLKCCHPSSPSRFLCWL